MVSDKENFKKCSMTELDIDIPLNTLRPDEGVRTKSKNVEKKKTSPTSWEILKQIYFDYCARTSIHGIQYMAERRPIKEKLFWLCVFCASIYCCFSLIEKIYSKWNETPVIVSFSEKSTPVWNIPFPAITICSETKRIRKTEGATYAKLFAMLKDDMEAKRPFRAKGANITEEELDEFRTLLHICNIHIIDEHLLAINNRTVDYLTVLDQMIPPFERNFFYCKWTNYFGDCDEFFTKTYTEDGICYTFNGLNASDLYRDNTYQYKRMGVENWPKASTIINRTLNWSLEKGYTGNVELKTYPTRVLGAGTRGGLFVALQSFKHEVDYACRGPVQGFKVLLHPPDDVPTVSKVFLRIPTGREVLIAVQPNMITTSAGIAQYHPLRRQCFVNSERRLRFFKIYTQKNCELECLTNFTLSKCGCVKFSMPRTTDMPVCGEESIHCYNQAEDDLLLREFSEGLKGSSVNHRGKTECNCLPACTSLIYNTEISQGNFDLEEMLVAGGDTEFLENNVGLEMSRLSIYFKENQFITSKRSELYGVTDFLANCGGIFGLFMGFSILSLAEMLYYFSLRLWSNMQQEM